MTSTNRTSAAAATDAARELNASDPEVSPFQYAVRLREEGERRHVLLGVRCLTNRWLRAVGFPTVEEAHSAARWMVENNAGIVSAQVVKFQTSRVIVKVTR